jgi:hypothetical protein
MYYFAPDPWFPAITGEASATLATTVVLKILHYVSTLCLEIRSAPIARPASLPPVRYMSLPPSGYQTFLMMASLELGIDFSIPSPVDESFLLIVPIVELALCL